MERGRCQRRCGAVASWGEKTSHPHAQQHEHECVSYTWSASNILQTWGTMLRLWRSLEWRKGQTCLLLAAAWRRTSVRASLSYRTLVYRKCRHCCWEWCSGHSLELLTGLQRRRTCGERTAPYGSHAAAAAAAAAAHQTSSARWFPTASKPMYMWQQWSGGRGRGGVSRRVLHLTWRGFFFDFYPQR